jgi:uncharacterized membrane protein
MEQASPPPLARALRWIVPLAAVLAFLGWMSIAPPGFLGKLDAIGYAVCHRLDSHSLHIGSIQMPLCARCTGEFGAAAIALLFQGIVSPKRGQFPKRSILIALGLLFLAFAFDGLNSYLGLMKSISPGALAGIPNPYVTTNITRVFTGSGMGLAMAAVLYPMYNQSVWRSPTMQPSLNWRQFAVLIAILLLVDFAVLTQSPLVLFPDAVLSVVGVLALLCLVFSIVWIIIMKLDNTFERLHELWLPALAGLTLALVLVLGIDLFRLQLTHTWGGFPGLGG